MNDSDSILLVDDHPLFRHGVKALIQEACSGVEIRESGTLAEAREALALSEPSHVILDVTLPDGDGVSFAREILEKLPECRIYILTMHRRSGLLLQAKKTGCRGYFLKEGDGSAVVEALKSGSSRFSVSPQLEDMLMSLDDESDTVRRYAELTRREKEVFRLFAEGLGYKEVAWSLGISPRTASVHRYNIFNKLGITGDVELVKAAQEVGLSV